MLLVVYFLDVPEVTTLLALGALEPWWESEDYIFNIYIFSIDGHYQCLSFGGFWDCSSS